MSYLSASQRERLSEFSAGIKFVGRTIQSQAQSQSQLTVFPHPCPTSSIVSVKASKDVIVIDDDDDVKDKIERKYENKYNDDPKPQVYVPTPKGPPSPKAGPILLSVTPTVSTAAATTTTTTTAAISSISAVDTTGTVTTASLVEEKKDKEDKKRPDSPKETEVADSKKESLLLIIPQSPEVNQEVGIPSSQTTESYGESDKEDKAADTKAMPIEDEKNLPTDVKESINCSSSSSSSSSLSSSSSSSSVSPSRNRYDDLPDPTKLHNSDLTVTSESMNLTWSVNPLTSDGKLVDIDELAESICEQRFNQRITSFASETPTQRNAKEIITDVYEKHWADREIIKNKLGAIGRRYITPIDTAEVKINYMNEWQFRISRMISNRYIFYRTSFKGNLVSSVVPPLYPIREVKYNAIDLCFHFKIDYKLPLTEEDPMYHCADALCIADFEVVQMLDMYKTTTDFWAAYPDLSESHARFYRSSLKRRRESNGKFKDAAELQVKEARMAADNDSFLSEDVSGLATEDYLRTNFNSIT